MRATLTLAPEAESLVRRLMQERGLTFGEAVNTTILQGAGTDQNPPTGQVTRTAKMGKPRLPLERALQLAAELQDGAVLEKTKRGK